jgi:hypothetical protein
MVNGSEDKLPPPLYELRRTGPVCPAIVRTITADLSQTEAARLNDLLEESQAGVPVPP